MSFVPGIRIKPRTGGNPPARISPTVTAGSTKTSRKIDVSSKAFSRHMRPTYCKTDQHLPVQTTQHSTNLKSPPLILYIVHTVTNKLKPYDMAIKMTV